MAAKLFENHEPRCEYCVHMYSQGDKSMCVRRRAEAVRACRAFEYDPLKRVPRQMPRLPEYRPEDFAGFEGGGQE